MILGDEAFKERTGNIAETYFSIRRENGPVRAAIWYWGEICKLVPRYIIELIQWRFVLFKNYFKISLRNLRKHKAYSFINIFGLALGLASCFLILLWTQEEKSYDRFHVKAPLLYRVINELDFGPNQSLTPNCAFPVGPTMKEEFPEVQEFSRFWRSRKLLISYKNKRFFEEGFVFADPGFLSMFSFPLIQGDPKSVLATPDSIVLTEAYAKKYFGSQDPIGKTLITNNDYNYKVTGIVKDLPSNSDFHFDFMASMESAQAQGTKVHWTAWWYPTYVSLQPHSSFQDLNSRLTHWAEEHGDSAATYSLQPLKEIHLYGLGGNGVIRSISFFSILALLILIIACINYMNLTTARDGTRVREIGIRKVMGADRRKISFQFLSESILMAFLALAAAVLLVSLFLPIFNNLAGTHLQTGSFLNGSLLLGIALITLLTGIMAGSYPAFFLSSLQAARILKGNSLPRRQGKSHLIFRKLLVIIQFSLAVVLIIGTVVVSRQMDFIQNRALGMEREHLVYMRLQGENNLWSKFNSLKTELKQNTGVADVTAATGLPFVRVPSEWGQLDWPGKSDENRFNMNHMAVDPDFIKTFKTSLVQGRFFKENSYSDASNFVLNETAVKATGLESPLGQHFRLLNKTGMIIGVIKDFHFSSLHRRIEPLILHVMPYDYWAYNHYVFVRIDNRDIPKTIADLKADWEKIVPEYPFTFEFLDDRINSLYQEEKKLRSILNLFTALAVAISCLGLFGLTSFLIAKRSKEIGIRKVLGASIPGITAHFSQEFLKLVLLANLIAGPVAFWLMSRWLRNFAYKTDFTWMIFAAAMGISLGIAMLTVSYQTIKAARADPVKALKYE